MLNYERRLFSLEADSLPPDSSRTLLVRGKSLPPKEKVGENGLFPKEEELLRELALSCDYMEQPGFALVEKAASLALKLHYYQGREGGDPYSTHCLAVAIELAKRRFDPLTVALALVHDTVEDTNISYEEVARNILGEAEGYVRDDFVNTLKVLSKIKARRLREKELAEENYHLGVIKSVMDNPRAAIIKVFDRLHNMRTIDGIANPARRVRICRETLGIYLPLAEIIGLRSEAEKLAELALPNLGAKYRKIVRQIKREKDQPERETALAEIIAETEELFQGKNIQIQARSASVYDVVEEMGEKPTVFNNKEHFFYHLDLALPSDQNHLFLNWAKEGLTVFTHYFFSEEYEVDLSRFNLEQFRNYAVNGLVDRLDFWVRRKKDGLRIHVHVYPNDVFRQEFASLADLYRQDKVKTREQDDASLKLAGWKKKLAFLEKKLNQGIINSSQLLLVLQRRLKQGFIRVIGVDDNDQNEIWNIPAGSTLIDYIRETSGALWSNAVSALVNGKQVDWNYRLYPNDQIRVFFDPKPHWQVSWIHALTDRKPARTVRRHLRQQLKEKEAVRESVVQQGLAILTGQISAKDLGNPYLYVSAAHAIPIIQKHYPSFSETDFLIALGLGEVPDKILDEVVLYLNEVNRNTGVIQVVFTTDRPGQLECLTDIIASKNINIRGIEIKAGSSERPSELQIFIDPSTDQSTREEIIDIIKNNQQALNLGLREARLTTVGQLLKHS